MCVLLGKTEWAAFPKLFWLDETYILSPFLLTSGTVRRTSLWKILSLVIRVILCGENTLQCCGKESIWRQHSHGTTSLWRPEWVHRQNPRSNSAPLTLPQDLCTCSFYKSSHTWTLLPIALLKMTQLGQRMAYSSQGPRAEDQKHESDIRVRDFPPLWGKSQPLGMDGWKSGVNSAWSTLHSELFGYPWQPSPNFQFKSHTILSPTSYKGW